MVVWHHKHTGKVIIKNGPASRLLRLWPMVRLSYRIGALGLGNHAVCRLTGEQLLRARSRGGILQAFARRHPHHVSQGDTADPVSVGQSAQASAATATIHGRTEVCKGC
jgi:hypothetical protein